MASTLNKSLSPKKAKMLTNAPISKELENRVKDKITMARVAMLFKQPFFGTLAMRIDIRPADNWVPTMAVDGKYMYYNHEFVDSLNNEELQFVVSHEVLHLVYDHLGRNEFRDHQLYNVAADYVVNDELVLAGVGKMPIQKITNKNSNGRTTTTDEIVGLHDVKYRGWNSENVYDDLLKQMQKSQQSGKGQKGDGSGDGSGNGSVNGMTLDELVDKLLDEHISPGAGKDGEEDDSKSGNGKNDGTDGPAKFDEETRKQLKAELMDTIVNLSKTCNVGNIPAGVQRIIEQMTAPKMDWRAMLQANLDSLIQYDSDYLHMNRKGWHLSVVLPGPVTDKQLEVAVAIDMSGSIGTKEAAEFLSEIQGIMNAYASYNILVFCFDTRVYNPVNFSNDDGISITTYVPQGGGGTSAACIFDYLKEEGIQPQKLCILTDGYIYEWGDPNYCSVLWVIKGSKEKPPFGEVAYMDDIN